MTKAIVTYRDGSTNSIKCRDFFYLDDAKNFANNININPYCSDVVIYQVSAVKKLTNVEVKDETV